MSVKQAEQIQAEQIQVEQIQASHTNEVVNSQRALHIESLYNARTLAIQNLHTANANY